MMAPHNPDLRAVGTQHPGRKWWGQPERPQWLPGVPGGLDCSPLRVSCSCTSAQQEPGLLTQAASFCDFSGASSQRKHTVAGIGGLHTRPGTTRPWGSSGPRSLVSPVGYL